MLCQSTYKEMSPNGLGGPLWISHMCLLVSWLILAPRPSMHFLHKTFPGISDKISHCSKFHGSSCLISWLPKFDLCETTECSPPLLGMSHPGGCSSVWKVKWQYTASPPVFSALAAPAGQHLHLHLPKSLSSGSFSCRQSLVLPRLTVRYSWGGQSLGVMFMAPNFPHSIFNPLSCTGAQ